MRVVPGAAFFLLSSNLLDDTPHMIDFEHEEWNQDPGLRRLLEAYEQQHDLAKRQQPEFDGWLPRVGMLEGVGDGEIPRLHGKLIAMGYLRFQLHDRRIGVQYQLDASARIALSKVAGGTETSAGADSDEHSHAA